MTIDKYLVQIFNKIFKLTNYIAPAYLRDNPAMIQALISWSIRHPRTISSVTRLLWAFFDSTKIRKLELKSGLVVPPLLIISITSKCNLRCALGYAEPTGIISNSGTKKSLDLNQWQKIIQEGKKLGVFSFLIAGGEPFVIPNLLQLMEKFNDRLFLVFTNGTLLKDHDLNRLKQIKNTIVIVSLEGNQNITDQRRGRGTYKKAINTIKKLNSIGIFNGVSVTVTRSNFKYWMNEKNIDYLVSNGVPMGIFLEYVPVDNNTDLLLTEKEHKAFRKKILEFRKNKQIFLIHSIGDEEALGGCASAGGWLAHITPFGDLTPCPVVSDIATHNLTQSTLREGLNSPFFKAIRDNHHLFEINGSPCGLIAHHKEFYEIANRVGTYKTTNKVSPTIVLYCK